MSKATPTAGQRRDLIDLYDSALPDVYGYLLARCGSVAVAEDLTSETFMAAVDAVQRDAVRELTVAWLIGVARHKLVDHWRRSGRDRNLVERIDRLTTTREFVDDWDIHLDQLTAQATLAELGNHHRGALVLRYLDDLPVRKVAALLGRTEGATEVLLVRAKAAFRTSYEQHQAGKEATS